MIAPDLMGMGDAAPTPFNDDDPPEIDYYADAVVRLLDGWSRSLTEPGLHQKSASLIACGDHCLFTASRLIAVAHVSKSRAVSQGHGAFESHPFPSDIGRNSHDRSIRTSIGIDTQMFAVNTGVEDFFPRLCAPIEVRDTWPHESVPDFAPGQNHTPLIRRRNGCMVRSRRGIGIGVGSKDSPVFPLPGSRRPQQWW